MRVVGTIGGISTASYTKHSAVLNRKSTQAIIALVLFGSEEKKVGKK
jgi:hypothetical protein